LQWRWGVSWAMSLSVTAAPGLRAAALGQCHHAGVCCNQLRGHCLGAEATARGVHRRAAGRGVEVPQEACQRWSGTGAAAGCLKSMSSAGMTHDLKQDS